MYNITHLKCRLLIITEIWTVGFSIAWALAKERMLKINLCFANTVTHRQRLCSASYKADKRFWFKKGTKTVDFVFMNIWSGGNERDTNWSRFAHFMWGMSQAGFSFAWKKDEGNTVLLLTWPRPPGCFPVCTCLFLYSEKQALTDVGKAQSWAEDLGLFSGSVASALLLKPGCKRCNLKLICQTLI